MANNIVATWGFKRKLPEPFEDYTDHAIFDDIASKYCTQPRKKSTLHAATLRAVLAFWSWKTRLAVPRRKSLGRSVPNPTILLWRNIRAKPVIFRWLSTTS